MADNNTESLFYTAEQVMKKLELKESGGYTYLEQTMATGKPFAVIRIGKLYRIPKESFDAWIKRINQPVQG